MSTILKHDLNIDNKNYSVMDACIKTESPEQAKLLLDRGMDFDLYTKWAETDSYAIKSGDTFESVKEYWENEVKMKNAEIAPDDQSGQSMGM